MLHHASPSGSPSPEPSRQGASPAPGHRRRSDHRAGSASASREPGAIAEVLGTEPPPPGTAAPSDRTPGSAELAAVAETVDAHLARTGVEGAGLVRVVGRLPDGTGPDAEVGWRPLDPDHDHPYQVLWGFVAPPDWSMLGVSTPGRAHHFDRPHERVPVRVTTLFDRSGASAGVLRRGDRTVRLTSRPEGLLPDTCRRALGLPTEPPPANTGALWTLAWLDRVVQATAGGAAPRPGWADLVALHPAVSLPLAAGGVGPPRPGAPAPEPDVLVAASLAAADAWPWVRLRTDPAAGPLRDAIAREAPVPAEVAAWMDDGMCARWLLSAFPAPADLLDTCRGLLPAPLADRVEAASVPALVGAGVAA